MTKPGSPKATTPKQPKKKPVNGKRDSRPSKHLPKGGGPTYSDWSDTKKRAVTLVAEAQWSFPRIAEELEIHRDTLSEWRKEPLFREKVKEAQDEQYKLVEEQASINRTNRVIQFDRQWRTALDTQDAMAIGEDEFNAKFNHTWGQNQETRKFGPDRPHRDALPYPRVLAHGMALADIKPAVGMFGSRGLSIKLTNLVTATLLDLDERIAKYTGEPWATRDASGRPFSGGIEDETPMDEGTRVTMTRVERAFAMLDVLEDLERQALERGDG